MALPTDLSARLSLPAIAAPMFLVSGPELVVAACREGVLGTFPSLNLRTNEEFDAWLTEIETALEAARADAPERRIAPFGVNIISHGSNERLDADLATCAAHQVPLIISSKGSPARVVDKVHAYGGRVFHDVINLAHARKAAAAGVDGLILVCAGAGGHAGILSPFAFLPDVRAFFDGTIILAGCLNDGRAIRAAEVMGADLAYIGTRFVATKESMAPPEYKQMLIASGAEDILYTPAISGIHANALIPSIREVGLDPDALPTEGRVEHAPDGRPLKAWKDIWTAGHGVGGIADSPGVKELIDRMKSEYDDARSQDAPARAAE
ncbi:MAG: NAD(P)H-dependent flavin oxidoreductase [Alphaproteobacteria bacterium]